MMRQKRHTNTATTTAVHAGLNQDTQGICSVVAPVYLTSNFAYDTSEENRRYDYTRHGNPTRDALAEALTQLEHGYGGVITASGMAAIHLTLCAFLKPSDRIIASHDCYGGTYRMLEALHEKAFYQVDFVDLTDKTAVIQACQQPVALFWVETPSNPLLRVVDLAWLAQLKQQHHALLAVDNTFLSPILQKPLALGADLVMHSTTKYINGHSDVIGGVLIAKTAEHARQIKWWDVCLGTTGAPFDAFLTLRGLRTLDVRMRVHQQNAQALSEFACQQPWIKTVHYPGLTSHAGHTIAKQQQQGFGGMLSLDIDTQHIDIHRFLSHLQLMTLALSLGGVETLICHPASMTHRSMSPQARHNAGIEDSLIRISVGLEDPHDLIHDLSQAAEKARR